MMRPTLQDVCKRAGVSTATVSRVMNHSPLVTEITRNRVSEAMQTLGYRPSYAARTLARRRMEILGVVFPGIASGFFTEVLSGIDEIAAEHKYHLMTAFSHGRHDEEQLVARLLQERRVDALIWLNLSMSDDFVRDAARHGLPIVVIDRPVEGDNLASISMDNRGGAAAATTHLLEHGHRSIAVITGPTDSYDAEHRLAGYREALKKAGVSISDNLIWRGAFTEESGRVAVERWLKEGNPLPDAIFATNDAMALGALGVLQERGCRAPDDVALVGFDDIASARHLGLTSVRVPMRAMGRAAAETAIKQISSREAQTQRVLATSLFVRRSCGCGERTEGRMATRETENYEK